MEDVDLRAEESSVGLPRPAGSTAAVRRATATRLERTGSGWEYGEEVELRVVLNRWFEVLQVGERERLYWSGIEVTAEKDSAGEHIVAALFPAQIGWYVHAPLRRTLKRRKEYRAGRVADWLKKGKNLRELPWDPFQQDIGWATARLNDPRRLREQNGVHLGNGYVRGREMQGDWSQAMWHFGICPEEALREFGLLGGEEDRRTAAVWRALAGRREGDSEDTLARRLDGLDS